MTSRSEATTIDGDAPAGGTTLAEPQAAEHRAAEHQAAEHRAAEHHADNDTAAVERALGRLIEQGFRFVHPRDDSGEIVTIVGVRAHGTAVDVVRLDAEDEVTASRVPGDEDNILEPRTILWQRTGAMREVIDDLLALPEPSVEAQAARRTASARGCWVPGTRGRSKWLMATG